MAGPITCLHSLQRLSPLCLTPAQLAAALPTVCAPPPALQGISKPLEAKLRPKGMGMGFGDYTEHKLVAEDKAKEKAKEEVVRHWQGGVHRSRRSVNVLCSHSDEAAPWLLPTWLCSSLAAL